MAERSNAGAGITGAGAGLARGAPLRGEIALRLAAPAASAAFFFADAIQLPSPKARQYPA